MITPQFATDLFLIGISYGGIVTFFGFGVGLSINLFKSYGGVR